MIHRCCKKKRIIRSYPFGLFNGIIKLTMEELKWLLKTILRLLYLFIKILKC